MQINRRKFTEFDFFMDEDVRAKRIGILCLEKTLTPALAQALFRVKESAMEYHKNRIYSSELTANKTKLSDVYKQLREIKWATLNQMRSFVALKYIKNFLHYWKKGPSPILFLNAPFIHSHENSINNFFTQIQLLKNPQLQNLQTSSSIFFLDTFSTPPGYKFEETVVESNGLSRCFRLDSRANDLLQLTDLLLGITVSKMSQKSTTNKAKQNLLAGFESDYESIIREISLPNALNNCIYYLK